MALTEVNSKGIKDADIATGDIAADAITGAKIADNAIDSEHYTDGSIDTAHIADDQVTLAKMASGTDGVIITYDASGNPVHVGPGTDGQVLTSTGAGSPPAFENAAAGGATINNATANELVTVASTTTELDAEANLTFDGNHLTLGDGDLVIGTAGHGISFAATADGPQVSHASELFDDYEFGTWNATCGNSVTLESGTDKATYIKIGRYVYLTGQLRVESDNSNANFDITNLPFTASNSRGEGSSTQYMSCAHYDLNVGSGTTGTKLVITEGSTTAVLAALKEDAGYSRVAAEADKWVILSGGYITDT